MKTPSNTLESSVLQDTLVALTALPGVIAWRHNTGQAITKYGGVINFGLVGSGDIIGCARFTVTRDMVGRSFGQGFVVETKRPIGGRHSTKQKNFADAWRKAGGLYVLATSVEDAVLAITEQDKWT